MQINVSSSKMGKCETVLKNLPNYISPSGEDAISIQNFFMLELSVEILANSITITGYNYDETRLIINKSLSRFIRYRIHSLAYFKRAIEYTIRHQFTSGGETKYLISFASRKLIRNLDLPPEFEILSRRMKIGDWNYIYENFDMDEFLSQPPSGFDLDSMMHRLSPIILETVPNNPILGLKKVNQSFELFRSIVNFAMSFRRFPINPNLPLSNFRQSPVTIIFEEDGQFQTYYYSYGNYSHSSFTVVKDKSKEMIHHLLRYFKIPVYPKYRTFLAESLIQYSTACDSIDWDSVFMALWINLEKIAFPLGENKVRYVPKRISRFVNIGEHTKDLLIYLKHFRNQLIHRGIFTDFDSSPAIFLKLLVEMILMKLIRNPWHARDLVELDYVHKLNKEQGNAEKLHNFTKQYLETL